MTKFSVDSYITSSNFVKILLQTGLVILLTIIVFVFYIRAEKQIDYANESRLNSYKLADELRSSSDDLTRKVRMYIATKNVIYKKHYQEILDIRNGKSPRPVFYYRVYWDMVGSDNVRPRPYSNQTIALTDMMKNVGFKKDELDKLTESKNNSDALSKIELIAMELIESKDNDSNFKKTKAQKILYDEAYHLAKLSIMRPIAEFYALMEHRTNYTVQRAESLAITLRYIFIASSLFLLYMLIRINRALKKQLGTTVDNLHSYISRTGSRNFSDEIIVEADMEDSVLGWLREMQKTLKKLNEDNATIHSQLTISHERLALDVIQMSKHIIFSKTNLDGIITEVSDAFVKIAQYSQEELVGQSHNILRHPDMPKSAFQDMWTTIQSGQMWSGEVKNRKKDGTHFWVLTHIEPEPDIDGNIFGYLAIRTDITDKKRIETISITDGLTSLYNRRHFDDTFPKQIKITKRAKGLLAFLLMDIDHFKQYNDTYGHQDGDTTLKLIATVLQDTMKRPNDYAFRVGGEEFALVYSIENEDDGYDIANKARVNIENLNIEHTGNSASKYVTISSGLYIVKSDDESSVDEIYKKADEALYIAKQSGRNQVSKVSFLS